MRRRATAAFARGRSRWGTPKQPQPLQQTLDEEKQADKKLTEIAATLKLEAVRRAG